MRDLEQAIIGTLAALRARRRRIEGLTGVWLAAAAPSRQDRLDRRPRLALGHDARLRAQRRPRPGAVHRLDHRLRARGRAVHVDRGRARATRVGRRGPRGRPRPRSPRSSDSSSKSGRDACPSTHGAMSSTQRPTNAALLGVATLVLDHVRRRGHGSSRRFTRDDDDARRESPLREADRGNQARHGHPRPPSSLVRDEDDVSQALPRRSLSPRTLVADDRCSAELRHGDSLLRRFVRGAARGCADTAEPPASGWAACALPPEPVRRLVRPGDDLVRRS